MERIKVRNGGKIVRVSENELDKYLTKGYVIVDTVDKKQAPEKVSVKSTTTEQPKPKTTRRKKD